MTAKTKLMLKVEDALWEKFTRKTPRYVVMNEAVIMLIEKFVEEKK